MCMSCRRSGGIKDVGELVLRCVTAHCQYHTGPETCMTSCLGLAIAWSRQLCALHINTNQFDAKSILIFQRYGAASHHSKLSRGPESCMMRTAAWLGQVLSSPCPGICEWPRLPVHHAAGIIASLPTHARRPQSALVQCSKPEVQRNFLLGPNRWS